MSLLSVEMSRERIRDRERDVHERETIALMWGLGGARRNTAVRALRVRRILRAR
ncbi:MAG: hypothetical protein JWO67_684 [Streptosporangiaceae bacterium]|nr:hypothetical protein [Streptosporangiaceae bacterium]